MMKKGFSRLLAAFVCLALLAAISAPVSSALNEGVKQPLRFDSSRAFKIMMINDTQDMDFVRPRLLKLINTALDTEKPDLVVFVGDNVADVFIGATEKRVAKAIDQIIQPLAIRGIPFAVTFGNHDAETGVSNETQMNYYLSYANCYADMGVQGTDAGTYSVPVLSSDGSKTAFNIYMMDTHNKDANGGYDGVHTDQIEWYENTGNALKSANGGIAVPSLLFQHIPVCEIYKLLKEVPAGTPGAVRRGSIWYLQNEELAIGSGKLVETPYPNIENRGQYDSWLKQGDIAGAFFGHDHVNSFMGKTQDGIIMGYNAGAGFRAYGDGDRRGVRIFTVNEEDPRNYDCRFVTYGELTNDRFDFHFSDLFSLRWTEVLLGKFYTTLRKVTFGLIDF